MANRLVAGLTTLIAILFFLASHVDTYFFLLHFLEAVIYLVILLLLFYGLEEWAYSLGFLTPLLWSVLAYLSGRLFGGLEALGQLIRLRPPDSPIWTVVGLILLAGLALMIACARAFLREVWGRREAPRVLIVSVLIVAAYYTTVVLTLLKMVEPVQPGR